MELSGTRCWNHRSSCDRFSVTCFCLVCPTIIDGSHKYILWGAIMLQRPIRLTGLSFLFVLSLSGAITGLSSNAFAQAQPASPESAAGSYVLGPNDRVRLKVYGEPDIAGEYEIDSNGQVSIPLAGHIRAAGLTTKQLERSIASALA
jgi:hypothetical protein